MEWLVPNGCKVAVDLAAGTGIFTRALLGRAEQVIAIEPDERMRNELARTSRSRIRIIDGVAEEIPLPDASADALFVHGAWHWLELMRAVPEISRTLRDGGRLGIVWTGRDRNVDWLAGLFPYVSRTVVLPEGSPFANVRLVPFRFTWRTSVPDALTWAGTHSPFLTVDPHEREARLARCRVILEAQADGDSIEIPMCSWSWRADRTARNALPRRK
jgi:SAM-dependent methyltransferase